MSDKEQAIFTNMCMIYNGDKFLVQDKHDPEWPGFTFPGGHVKPKESFVDSTIREMKEQTGLDVRNLKLCGIKQWTHSTKNYRYIVFLYKTNEFSGQLKEDSQSTFVWIDKNNLPYERLARGFDTMLELFKSDEVSENYHWYECEYWHQTNK